MLTIIRREGIFVQFSSGSIRNYVKSLELQQKWTQKKNDPAKLRDDSLRSIGAPDEEETSATRLRFITQRLQTGKKLDGEEMEYLRKHNPDLYAKARAIQAERESYERALRRCRSRDEVRALHVGKVGAVRGGLGGSVSAEDSLMRLSAYQSEYDNFRRSTRYRDLPEALRRKKRVREV
jgi:hypothetical protein